MADVKHTPGPWTIQTEERSRNQLPYRVVYTGQALKSGDLQWVEVRGDDREANARLIAAAPDLLEACQAALNMVEIDQGPPDWDLLRAAIRKATSPTT